MKLDITKLLENGYSKEDIFAAIDKYVAAKEEEEASLKKEEELKQLEENYLNAAIPYLRALGLFANVPDKEAKEIVKSAHDKANSLFRKIESPKENSTNPINFLNMIRGLN